MDMEVEEWTGQGVQRNDSWSVTAGRHLALQKNFTQRTPSAHAVSFSPQNLTDL